MNRYLLSTVLTCLIIILYSVNSSAEINEINYPNAVNKLIMNDKNIKKYKKLAKRIGFDTDVQYSYTDYANIKRKNKVGIAGAYEFMLLSTGGTSLDYEAMQRFNSQQCGWEMMYYSNHDLTVIYEICNSPDRSTSFVRILKVAEGRRPNLHLE